jgi:hypothetical protein
MTRMTIDHVLMAQKKNLESTDRFVSHQKLYIIYPIVLLLFFKPLKKAHKMVEKAKLCW